MPSSPLLSRKSVATAATFGLLLAAGLLAGHRAALPFRKRAPFDREAWIQAGPHDEDATGYPIRFRMMRDLLRRHRLVGMDRKDVLDLLGMPDYEFDLDSEHILGWEFGVIRGRGSGIPNLDFMPLFELEIGPDGRVSRSPRDDAW